HFLLNIERGGVDDDIAPVLLILAAPYKLRVKITVAALVSNRDGILLLLLQDGLELRGWNVLPLGSVMLERLYALGGNRFLCHVRCLVKPHCFEAESIILLNSLSTLALKSA